MTAIDERLKILKEIIKPAFKEAGFKTSGNNFVREEDGFIKVFSLENSSWNTKDYASFTLRIGILFPVIEQLRNRPIRKFPSTAGCHFEIVSNVLNNSRRLFDITPDTDIEEFRNYTADVITNYVIPFFERYKKIEDCLELLTLYPDFTYGLQPYIGLALIGKGNIEPGKKLIENMNPSYLEKYRQLILGFQDQLLSKQETTDK